MNIPRVYRYPYKPIVWTPKTKHVTLTGGPLDGTELDIPLYDLGRVYKAPSFDGFHYYELCTGEYTGVVPRTYQR